MYWEAENTVTIHPDRELLDKKQPSAVDGYCSVKFGKKFGEKPCHGVIAAIG